MTNPINNALEALRVAKECGVGEVDLQHYRETHAALEQAVKAARAYDASLEAGEQAPTGADYEYIMSLLGLRTVDAPVTVDDHANVIAAPVDSTATGAETASPCLTPLDVAAAIEAAQKADFPPDARVAGVLVNADIAPVSFGDLYRPGHSNVETCTCFQAIGTDSRNGYDLVQAESGEAYVIVSYAEHAKKSGLSHLKAHVAANPECYAQRRAAWNKPAPAALPA